MAACGPTDADQPPVVGRYEVFPGSQVDDEGGRGDPRFGGGFCALSGVVVDTLTGEPLLQGRGLLHDGRKQLTFEGHPLVGVAREQDGVRLQRCRDPRRQLDDDSGARGDGGVRSVGHRNRRRHGAGRCRHNRRRRVLDDAQSDG